jgi:hypothetical protein
MSRCLISTPAKPTECPQCRAQILAGYDTGLRTHVDPRPVDQAAELAALLAGLRTYAMVGGELAYRSAFLIRHGQVGRGIHVEHRCATYVQPTLIGAA